MNGASASSASTSYGGGSGGVGGKATRNQFRSRSRTTPYDRPPTARRNPSLLSKLVVDPIRNLVSSAHRFFASVTGKSITPAPQLPSGTDGLEDGIIKNKAEALEPLTVDDQNLGTTNAGGISELKLLLKQKTFTRSEIDHLTELLQSRAVDDLRVDSDVIRVEASLSDLAANFEKPQQIQNSLLAENGARERADSAISTPGISAIALKRRRSILYDDVGSISPLRRIRQKQNLSSQRLGLVATRGVGGASSNAHRAVPSSSGVGGASSNAHGAVPSTSYSHVPPRSSELGARILQQLEEVPAKEKSAESELVTAREKSPAKLTTDMLHGRALRSVEDTNSLKRRSSVVDDGLAAQRSQKKPAFRMSVHEDTVDVGGEQNGVAFPALQALLNKPEQESDKIPTTENSPVPLVPDLSSPKPSFGTQPTAESLSSSGVVVPTREVPRSDTNDNNKAVEAAEVKGKPENEHSILSSPPSSTIASFVVPENSKVKNGPLSTVPSAVLPAPTVASTGICSQKLSAGASPFSISASVTNFSAINPSSAVSSSAFTTSDAAPSVAKTDREKEATTTNLSFGLSPSTASAETELVDSGTGPTSDAAPSVAKTDREKEATTTTLSFGLSPSTASAETELVDSGTGPSSGVFSFGTGASNAASGANAFSLGSNTFSFDQWLSSSATSSLNSAVVSSSNTPPAIYSFGASSSSGAGMICSSAGTSSAIFGASTLSSSSETNAANSSSAASVLFGSSWQTPNSSPFGATSSSPPIFSTGASSSSFAAANTAPTVFGSATAATSSGLGSSFTAASSPTSTTIRISCGFSRPITIDIGIGRSNFFSEDYMRSSTLSSSPETDAASSSSAASVMFGSSWQSPTSSPFGATSSSPPIFSMGASSSSFAAANTAPMVFGSSTAATSSWSMDESMDEDLQAMDEDVQAMDEDLEAMDEDVQAMDEDLQAMDEDVQARAPAVPVFGQQSVTPPPDGFAFGPAVPPQSASPFQSFSPSSPFTSRSTF